MNFQNNAVYGQPQNPGQYQQVPQGQPLGQQAPPNAQFQQMPPQQQASQNPQAVYQQPYSYPQGGVGNFDVIAEDPNNLKNKQMNDDEVSDQMQFVRKVYGILASQLTLTAFFICAVQMNDEMKGFFMTSQGAGISACASIGSIVSMIMIICCFRRKTPHNYVLLFIFTLCESYMVAGITARYERELVVTAGLGTAFVSIALTIYAMNTKKDISVFYAMAFVVYFAMFPFLLLAMVMQVKMFYIAYCCMGLLFYSIFLIIDTMQICKGSSYGGYALELDEYIVGALMLYVDIIMIFIYILRLLGQNRD